MKVAELKSFLDSLTGPLAASGGKRIADDLHRASGALTPLQEMSLAEFETFLVQASEYYRTGVLPVRSSPKSKKKEVNAAEIQAIAQEVLSLYERAIDESVSYTTIETEIKRLNKQLSAGQAKELAKQVGIEGSIRTKKAALQGIERKIMRRKESYQRTAF